MYLFFFLFVFLNKLFERDTSVYQTAADSFAYLCEIYQISAAVYQDVTQRLMTCIHSFIVKNKSDLVSTLRASQKLSLSKQKQNGAKFWA